MSSINTRFNWIPRGLNRTTKHSTPKTPEEEKKYKKYVENQKIISNSIKQFFNKSKERNENPILRNLLHKLRHATNTNRNNALTKYLNMIKKLNNSKKNLNNSNSNKSAKRHKSNPKNL